MEVINPALRNAMVSEVLGACNRLGNGRVMAHIKYLGVPSGRVVDCDELQLIKVVSWCLHEVNKLVPTQAQSRSRA